MGWWRYPPFAGVHGTQDTVGFARFEARDDSSGYPENLKVELKDDKDVLTWDACGIPVVSATRFCVTTASLQALGYEVRRLTTPITHVTLCVQWTARITTLHPPVQVAPVRPTPTPRRPQPETPTADPTASVDPTAAADPTASADPSTSASATPECRSDY